MLAGGGGGDFKGRSFHDGFGGFDGFSGSGKHLTLLSLAVTVLAVSAVVAVSVVMATSTQPPPFRHPENILPKNSIFRLFFPA